jgi:selenocysteine lyase/cysteine desulfurase
MNRKDFIYSLGLGAVAPSALKGGEWLERVPKGNPNDEKFWEDLARSFPKNYQKGGKQWGANIVNLENGYFSHMPPEVFLAHVAHQNHINDATSLFMRLEQQDEIEKSRIAFAQSQNLDPDELAFTRNTTESLNAVIMGFPWKAGDEVVIGNQDYGSMVEAFEQVSKRYGVVVKVANVPLSPEIDEDVVASYLKEMTSKTRMVHITHLINLSGQILPLQKILNAVKAFKSDVMTVVDAAHSVNHVVLKMGDLLQADAIGASLHKWTCAPIGVGMLAVKKDWISQIWPLMGDSGDPSNIRKFEHQGTRPIDSLMALRKAIEFGEKIGGAVPKWNRLVFLRKLILGSDGNGFNFKESGSYHLVCNEDRLGAICCIKHKDKTVQELQKDLMKEGIFTVGIEHKVVQGVRITPHLSTSKSDALHLNSALAKLA